MVNTKGLNWSDLRKIKVLWGNANQFQKDAILHKSEQNGLKISTGSEGVQNRPKKKKFGNKTEDLRIKN